MLDDERLVQTLRMSIDGSSFDRLKRWSIGLRYILYRDDVDELEEVSASQLNIKT